MAKDAEKGAGLGKRGAAMWRDRRLRLSRRMLAGRPSTIQIVGCSREARRWIESQEVQKIESRCRRYRSQPTSVRSRICLRIKCTRESAHGTFLDPSARCATLVLKEHFAVAVDAEDILARPAAEPLLVHDSAMVVRIRLVRPPIDKWSISTRGSTS